VNPFLGQIPYRLFRAWGRPQVLPFNYTFSLTSRCHYRCGTCRVYQRSGSEMTAEQYRLLFLSLGRSPYWATFSGGEPFLRQDLEEIVGDFCRMCRPKLVNIPTNGSMPGLVGDIAKRLARAHPSSGFIVNVSIDAAGDRQDDIRGQAGAWRNAVEAVGELKKGRPANLTVGIGTVVSKLNLDRFREDRRILAELGADHLVAEPAEIREELGNKGLDITPSAEDYRPIAEHLVDEIRQDKKKGWPGLAQAFRMGYYLYVNSILSGGKGLACYAGFASAQVMPDGEVWACCLRGDRMGRLPEYGHDFGRLWRSETARAARRAVKARGCACPLANAYYSNVMFNARGSAGLLARILRPC
jgi:MoaA/NifB/PqqE/SkfB family radical SAM enzyme